MRDVWNQRQVPCQAITVDDRIIATAGGGVLCCDLLGQVHWLRRQMWLPKALDDNLEQQFVQPPLEHDGLLYVMQQGVRTVECLETATGRVRWQHVLPDVRRICGLTAGKLIVETAGGIEAVDSQTGVSAWRRTASLLTAQACGSPGGVLIVENERIDAESWRPVLVWLDPATGRQTGPLAAIKIRRQAADGRPLRRPRGPLLGLLRSRRPGSSPRDP